MARTITLVPNYGRDYATADEVRAAWNANKDFRVQDMSSSWNGAAVNREDLERFAPDMSPRIRFDRLTEVVIL